MSELADVVSLVGTSGSAIVGAIVALALLMRKDRQTGKARKPKDKARKISAEAHEATILAASVKAKPRVGVKDRHKMEL